jgi:hypothetical protein
MNRKGWWNDEDLGEADAEADWEREQLEEEEEEWLVEKRDVFWRDVGCALTVEEGARLWHQLRRELVAEANEKAKALAEVAAAEDGYDEEEEAADLQRARDAYRGDLREEEEEEMGRIHRREDDDGDNDSLHSWVSVADTEESWCYEEHEEDVS